MSVADLYGGLAKGIFGGIQKQEEQQRQSDLQQKETTLKYLTSLIGDATPETRPVLLTQIAETIGLKGKHRGVWDMLTGGGREDYHQQLSKKLDSVMGRVVGPQRYEELKSHPTDGVSSVKTYAGMPVGATQAMTPDQTAGKIALQDPTAERAKLYAAQYGLQAQNKSNNLWESAEAGIYKNNEINDNKAGNRMDQIDRQAVIKANQKIEALASEMAFAGGEQVEDRHRQMAARQLIGEGGDARALIQATIEYRKAGAANQRAQAGSVDPTTGLPAQGRPMSQGQEAGLSQSLTNNAIAAYNQWGSAAVRQKKLELQVNDLRAKLNSIEPLYGKPATPGEYRFDEANGIYINKENKAVRPSPTVQALIDQLKKAERDKQGAIQEMEQHRGTLGAQFGDQYDTSDQWNVKPKDGYRPAGVTNSGGKGQPPPFPAGVVTAPNPNLGKPYQTSRQVPVGTILPGLDGNKWRVTGTISYENGVYTYSTEPVKE